MSHKSKIETFYADLEYLDLKFPVAIISKETGLSKGTVSEYINKKKQPSDRFIELFYKKFGDDLKKVPRETEMTTYSNRPNFETKTVSESEKDKTIEILKQHIQDLKDQVEFLKSLIQEKKEKR